MILEETPPTLPEIIDATIATARAAGHSDEATIEAMEEALRGLREGLS